MIRVGQDPFLLIAAFLSSACAYEVGNGRILQEQREVPSFSKVAVHGGLDVQIGRGERAVSVTTDENLLRFVESYVDADTLVLGVKQGMELSTAYGIRATVSNEALFGLDVSGGSRVRAVASAAPEWSVVASGGSEVSLSSVSAGQLIADASGGSLIRASGAARDGFAVASGGSRLNLEGAPIENLVVNASGASVLEVRASSAVEGQASGGSEVTVWGSPPKLRLSTSGASRVRQVQAND